MRVGDFSVEIIGAGGGITQEVESGHVLARPGQVYVLRLRNHGPLRCVAEVSIDGRKVSGNGLVLNAWSTVDLERPIHATERGRFTVIAEGDERVFGPDGGRDNPDLGLIEARFRRELPNASRPDPSMTRGMSVTGLPGDASETDGAPSRRSLTPPDPTSPTWNNIFARFGAGQRRTGSPDVRAFMAPQTSVGAAEEYGASLHDGTAVGGAGLDEAALTEAPGRVERAAGTGLTGTSMQEFVRVHVGPLETEATVIRLRLVIGSEEAVSAPRPLPVSDAAPARPAPRP